VIDENGVDYTIQPAAEKLYMTIYDYFPTRVWASAYAVGRET
jgi:hypothetical protein